jgi:hypothetical protein
MSWDDGADWNDWKVQHDPDFKMGDQSEPNGELFVSCSSTSVQAFGWTTRCSTMTVDLGPDSTFLNNDPEATSMDIGDPDRAPSQSAVSTTRPGSTLATGVVTATATNNKADGAAEATVVASSASSGGGGGVSNGAVAGIAIGTALAGAAIALLVAFLIFKRRNGKRGGGFAGGEKYASTPELLPSLGQNGSSSYQPVRDLSNVPPPVIAAAAIPHHRSTSSLPSLLGVGALPPPADESVIASKISTLFKQIHLHVENFYRDVHASITPSMEPELAKFGMGNTSMTELLRSSSQPTIAIKHALVAYVLGITSADGAEDETLFPKEVVGISAKEQITNSQGKHEPNQHVRYRLETNQVRSLTIIRPIQTPRSSPLHLVKFHSILSFAPIVQRP